MESRPAPDTHAYRHRLAMALLFCSGFAAISYEVIWQRQMGLVLGNTVYAASIVLTAFMLGFAGGAYLAGRWIRKTSHPLRLFVLLELSIGICGLLMPIAFPLVRELYRLVYLHLSDWMSLLMAFRVALAIGILSIPTLLMGATLPVICEGILPGRTQFKQHVGQLYGANTFGAVIGILICGFFLIPAWGLTITNGIAILINWVVAGITYWAWKNTSHTTPVSQSKSTLDSTNPTTPQPPQAPGPNSKPILIWLAWTSALAGFFALSLEIMWVRGLSMINGGSVYSFTTMLSIFLLGIAVGSAILGFIADKKRLPLTTLPLLFACIGFYILLSTYCFPHLPAVYLNAIVNLGFGWSSHLLMKFATALFFLFIPTLLFGALFTFTSHEIRKRSSQSGHSIGTLYAVNTAGAAAGALLSGLFLLAWLGLELALLCLGSGMLIFSCLLLAQFVPNRTKAGLSIAGILMVTTACLALLPSWSAHTLWLSPYYRTPNLISDNKVYLQETLDNFETLYLHEGINSTVAVTQYGDQGRSYLCDGKIEADTSNVSMSLQLMIAHLPMLFHENPKKALNIGLGTGITTGALSCYPLDTIRVIELEAATTAVCEFFSDWNEDIIHDSRFDLHINDGRNYLFVTDQQYDVIVSDPIEPILSGAGPLFTYEHFLQMNQKLAPGGIAAQFLPLYDTSETEFVLIMRSFAHAFPNSLLFYTGTDCVLLGFKDEIKFNASRLIQKLSIPRVRYSLQRISADHMTDILGMLVVDLRRHPEFTSAGPLNTDAHPIVEYHAPRNVFRHEDTMLEKVLLKYYSPLPSVFSASLNDQSLQELISTREAMRLCLKASVLIRQQNLQAAEEELSAAHLLAPDNQRITSTKLRLLNQYGDNLLKQGHYDLAFEKYYTALLLEPSSLNALARIAEYYIIQKNFSEASHYIYQGIRHHSESIRFTNLKLKLKAAQERAGTTPK